MRSNRSTRRTVVGAMIAVVASATILVACTDSGEPPSAPGASATADASSPGSTDRATMGTNAAPGTTIEADGAPDHLTVVHQGTLPSTTACAPTSVDPSVLERAQPPGAFLPPGAVVSPGIPALTGRSLGGWYTTRQGLVQIELGSSATATAAFLIPERCVWASAIRRGSTLVVVLCDISGGGDPASCNVAPFDTTTSTFGEAHEIPAELSVEHTNVDSPAADAPMTSTERNPSTDPPHTSVVIDPVTGTWREVENPCGRYGAQLIGTDAPTDLEFSCESDSSVVSYASDESLARRSVRSATTDDGLRPVCGFDGGAVVRDERGARWVIVDDDGAELTSAPSPAFLFEGGCSATEDLLVLSYSIPGSATIELRRRDDLEVLGSITWPSETIPRNPAPTPAGLLEVTDRRAWLLVKENLAFVDL